MRVAGFDVVNPIKLIEDPNTEWKDAMKKCISEMMFCDVVYALPCSSYSEGAKMEIELAYKIGIPVVYDTADLLFIGSQRKELKKAKKKQQPMRILKPEIETILSKMKGVNVSEDFVRAEFLKNDLKKEMHRYSYEINYTVLGDCHISSRYTTMSKTAEIAVMKSLLIDHFLGNDENYI